MANLNKRPSGTAIREDLIRANRRRNARVQISQSAPCRVSIARLISRVAWPKSAIHHQIYSGGQRRWPWGQKISSGNFHCGCESAPAVRRPASYQIKRVLAFLTRGGAHLPLIDSRQPRHSSKKTLFASLRSRAWWNKARAGCADQKRIGNVSGLSATPVAYSARARRSYFFCQRHHARSLCQIGLHRKRMRIKSSKRDRDVAATLSASWSSLV